MALDPGLKIVLEQLAANPGPQLHELPVAQARAFFEQMQLPRPEVKIAAVEDRRIPGPAGEIPVRIYRPEGSEPFPGAGLLPRRRLGDRQPRDARRLVPRPRQSHRLRGGLGGLPARAREPVPRGGGRLLRRDEVGRRARAASSASTRSASAIGGDSAGGNLTAAVALMARDRGGPALRHQLLIYPVTDADFYAPVLSRERRGLPAHHARRWSGSGITTCRTAPSAQEAYASPLRAKDLAGPAAGLRASPPSTTRCATRARPTPSASRQAGVPTRLKRYDGAIHGFFAMGLLAQVARDAVDDAVTAVRRGLGG